MASQVIKISAIKREQVGRSMGALRSSGYTPAVIYERASESASIAFKSSELKIVWSAAGKHHTIEVDIDGTIRLCLFKAVSRIPGKSDIAHVELQAVKRNEKVNTDIPVEVKGDVPAIKAGYFLVHPNTSVEIEAIPANIPDMIYVDGGALVNPGDTITVADIAAISGVEIMTEGDRVLVVVEESKADIAAEAAAPAEEAVAEA
jgi:large subunit ribosomal protein L25